MQSFPGSGVSSQLTNLFALFLVYMLKLVFQVAFYCLSRYQSTQKSHKNVLQMLNSFKG